MTIIDIILLICFIPAIAVGLSKGFIKQAVGIVSVFAGAWVAVKYSDALATWLGTYFTAEPKIMKIASFAIIALAVTAVLLALGSVATRIFNKTILGPANRILGMVFGILKAFVILGLAVTVFDGINSYFGFVGRELLDRSTVYNFIHKTMLDIIPWFKSVISETSANV